VQCHKNLDGLVILEFERFNRAMRVAMAPMEATQQTVVRPTAETVVLGNGLSTKFLHDPWLHGQTPKEIASALLRFAWHKKLMVAQALQGVTR
jgi:hypothetical protein